MVVTQALPFLRLDTAVTDDGGQRARIARVAIAMDGDMPKLLVELEHEVEDPLAEIASHVIEPSADPHADTVPFVPGVSARPARGDCTVPYEIQARESKPEVVVVGADAQPETETTSTALAAPATGSWLTRLIAWFAVFFRPAPVRS
jgi:hypothetical protein